MNLFTLSQIGEFHTNHNEDCLTANEIGNEKILLAVMDGCSMGTESHFASTLIAKILRKIAKEINFKDFVEQTEKSLLDYLEEILSKLFDDMKFMKSKLMLEREEVLSTLILGVLDLQEKQAELIVIGDGLICCNGQLAEYEQDDKPDYLGYHLETDFKNWFPKQKQRLSLTEIKDLSIATDGIFTFKKFDNDRYATVSENRLIDLLLVDNNWNNQENMLHKKLAAIASNFGLKPSDDLSILRIMID